MSYEKIRKNTKGGKLIAKFQTPAGPLTPDQQEEYDYLIQNGYSPEQARNQLQRDALLDSTDFNSNATYADMTQKGFSPEAASFVADDKDFAAGYIKTNNITTDSTGRTQQEQFELAQNPKSPEENSQPFQSVDYGAKAQKMQKAANVMGVVGEAATAAISAVDGALMGDKNFSAQSQAIDQAVHGVSGALMKSGNPYAMAAGVALEGINFITKAGGKTVPGFDVNINNSGYGNMGHMSSESGRIWNNMDKKLAKRNEQARMALAAADISQEQQYQQEARANSVTNVLQQNQIALAGGVDPSLLAG